MLLRARNHGEKFPKYSQTSFSGIVNSQVVKPKCLYCSIHGMTVMVLCDLQPDEELMSRVKTFCGVTLMFTHLEFQLVTRHHLNACDAPS